MPAAEASLSATMHGESPPRNAAASSEWSSLNRREFAMWMDTACAALQQGRRLELRYDGYTRIVEVHAVGVSSARHAAMRVWQVRGGSVSGERSGWKLMRLDEALSAHIIDEPSEAPRSGYKRGDKDLVRIHCQI